MNGIVCPDLPTCQALAAQVDTSLGYPVPGRDIGDGIHAPASQSITTTYAAPVALTTKGQFGYPVDAVNTKALDTNQKAAVVPLDVAATVDPGLGTVDVKP